MAFWPDYETTQTQDKRQGRVRPAGVSRYGRSVTKNCRIPQKRIHLRARGRGRERHVRAEGRGEIIGGEWVWKRSGGGDVWTDRFFWRGLDGGPGHPDGHGHSHYTDHTSRY